MKILSAVILLGAIAAFASVWSMAENINQQLLACSLGCFGGIIARVVQAYDNGVRIESNPIVPTKIDTPKLD